MDFFDDNFCPIQDREISESEKIHFQKSEGFEWTSRKLSYRRGWIFWWWLEWTEMCHWLRGDNNRTGMNSELTNRSFHLIGSGHNFCIFILCFTGFLEFSGFLHGFFQTNAWTCGYELRKIIHLTKRDA